MTLKLTYFPGHGRAFAIRTCLRIAGIEFENVTLSLDELKAVRGETGRTNLFPLGQVPVLTLPDGKVITQSIAISRYVARLAKLYPEDPVESLLIDEIMDIAYEALNGIPRGIDDPAVLKVKREEYAAGKLTTYFTYLAEKLQATGPYFSGSKYSVADFHVYKLVKFLDAGFWDHIPKNFNEKWPVLAVFVDALESDLVFSSHKI